MADNTAIPPSTPNTIAIVGNFFPSSSDDCDSFPELLPLTPILDSLPVVITELSKEVVIGRPVVTIWEVGGEVVVVDAGAPEVREEEVI